MINKYCSKGEAGDFPSTHRVRNRTTFHVFLPHSYEITLPSSSQRIVQSIHTFLVVHKLMTRVHPPSKSIPIQIWLKKTRATRPKPQNNTQGLFRHSTCGYIPVLSMACFRGKFKGVCVWECLVRVVVHFIGCVEEEEGL